MRQALMNICAIILMVSGSIGLTIGMVESNIQNYYQDSMLAIILAIQLFKEEA